MKRQGTFVHLVCDRTAKAKGQRDFFQNVQGKTHIT